MNIYYIKCGEINTEIVHTGIQTSDVTYVH